MHTGTCRFLSGGNQDIAFFGHKLLFDSVVDSDIILLSLPAADLFFLLLSHLLAKELTPSCSGFRRFHELDPEWGGFHTLTYHCHSLCSFSTPTDYGEEILPVNHHFQVC